MAENICEKSVVTHQVKLWMEAKSVKFYNTTLELEPVLNQFSTVTLCRFPACVFYTRVCQVTSYILAKEVKVSDSSETLVPIYKSKGLSISADRTFTLYFVESVVHIWPNFMFCWPCILVRLWVNDQPDAQLRHIIRFFIIIILYMFRATLCSSSGSQIVLIQRLV